MYLRSGNLLDARSKSKTKLVETLCVKSVPRREKNYQYYLLLGIEAKHVEGETPILSINHNPSISPEQTGSEFSLSIKNGKDDDKYCSFLKSNIGTIRGIFEERFFLSPHESIHLLASKYHSHHKVNFGLLSLSTKVNCSAIISRTGEIANFLLNDTSQAEPLTTKMKLIISDDNILENKLDRFFKHVFSAIDISRCKEHFYNVFDLYLKGSFGFIQGSFINSNNQIMYKISFWAIAQFFIMLDDYENFLGIFSAKSKESIKNEIGRILKFYDDKLKIKLL